jgi:peptide/nickel transport system substrate-binding protein
MKRWHFLFSAISTVMAVMLSAGSLTPAELAPKGHVRLALSSLGPAEKFLPWADAGCEPFITQRVFYDFLLYSDPNTGELRPGLVESWVPEDGGKTWRFHLRKGVQFQQGYGELTAEDVKFTLERLSSKESLSSWGRALSRDLDRIEVVNPYEFVIRLKKPDVVLASNLVEVRCQIVIVSKKYVEAVGEAQAAEKPVGSGPFRLVEHRRQVSARFEATVPHWRKTPGFATMTIFRVDEPAARLAMLRAGEVDVAEIPFKLLKEAEAAGFAFARSKGATLYHIHLGGMIDPKNKNFNPNVPWVVDPANPASAERALKVRRALNLAVNKREIINAIFLGRGESSIVPFLPPGSVFVPADLKPYAFDPKQARTLLAEAGYAGGVGFPPITARLVPFPGRSEQVDVAEAVAGYWEKNLGLKIKREVMDWAALAQKLSARNEAGIIWAYGSNPRPAGEPVVSMVSWVPSWSSYDAIGDIPGVDRLYEAIMKEPEPEKRKLRYRDLARYFYDNYLAVPIASVDAQYAVNPKVVNVKKWNLVPGESYIHNYEFLEPLK